ncbi:PAS domain-containing protein [Rhizobium sp. SAFR-030]|uniref:PAS domain-containing protein n=1 Tax=Rhizobium sp. SAFR-030 TaxID=3387277 RepID=UPI003F7DBB3B
MDSASAPDANALVIVAQDVGIFSWDVISDRLRGDSEIAGFFGLPSEDVARGLGISQYLNRVFYEDRERVAAAIHGAIVAGGPYQEEYRITRPNGETVTVTAIGRCFFDEQGDPVQYCGVMFKSVEEKAEVGHDIVRSFVTAAQKHAAELANPKIAALLEPVLEELDSSAL